MVVRTLRRRVTRGSGNIGLNHSLFRVAELLEQQGKSDQALDVYHKAIVNFVRMVGSYDLAHNDDRLTKS